MSALLLPLAPEEITAEWLTAALRQRFPDISVERVEIIEVMPGTATKIRMRASYADGQDELPPQTLCIKGGFDRRRYRKAAGAVVKRMGLMDTDRAYQLEAMFYHDLAPAVKASQSGYPTRLRPRFAPGAPSTRAWPPPNAKSISCATAGWRIHFADMVFRSRRQTRMPLLR